MATVLYLAHRLPLSPDKGDKVRTHPILRHLAERQRLILGAFVDAPADLPLVVTVGRWCDQIKAVRLRPRWVRVQTIAGLFRREPLSLAHYRDPGLRACVRGLLDSRKIDAVVVSCSSMAPYADGFDVPVVMDFIDVDSTKWQACMSGTVDDVRPWLQRCGGGGADAGGQGHPEQDSRSARGPRHDANALPLAAATGAFEPVSKVWVNAGAPCSC